MNEVLTAISTVGFPIFTACALGFIMYKILGRQIEIQAELNKHMLQKLEEVADAMLSAGCQTGFNLDGGGSTQLVIKKTGTTTGTKIACRDGSSGTNCRNIVEGIYFVEK